MGVGVAIGVGVGVAGGAGEATGRCGVGVGGSVGCGVSFGAAGSGTGAATPSAVRTGVSFGEALAVGIIVLIAGEALDSGGRALVDGVVPREKRIRKLIASPIAAPARTSPSCWRALTSCDRPAAALRRHGHARYHGVTARPLGVTAT